MKKLVFLLILSLIAIVLIVVLTFFYIAFTGHSSFRYNSYTNGRLSSTEKLDKYVTEDKIIYKNKSSFVNSLGYQKENKELFLNRKTLMPLKFKQIAYGAENITREIILKQNKGKTDLLFLDYPVFFDTQDFNTGEKTSLFLVNDVVSCLALMERYNYWKKGTQYFEVMMPLDAPFPVLRDKVEVKYIGNAYVPILGKRCEAERFAVKSKGIPVMEIAMSKYSHILLYIFNGDAGVKITLEGAFKDFGNIFSPLFVSEGDRFLLEDAFKVEDKPVNPTIFQSADGKEVFFESGNLMLEGHIWSPDGEGPFPAIIYLGDEGPMMQGEREFLGKMSAHLVKNGIAVFSFNMPGKGKSQGNYRELDDNKMMKHIEAGYDFLVNNPKIDSENISLLGFKDSGFLAVCSSEELPVTSSVILGLPDTSRCSGKDACEDVINRYLSKAGLYQFDEEYMDLISEVAEEQYKSIMDEENNYLFFMRKKLSAKAYREYLKRDFYDEVLSNNKSLLLAIGQDDENFDQDISERLKKIDSKDNVKVVVYRRAGKYMGNLEKNDKDEWEFTPNISVLDMIVKWVMDMKKTTAKQNIQTGVQ